MSVFEFQTFISNNQFQICSEHSTSVKNTANLENKGKQSSLTEGSFIFIRGDLLSKPQSPTVNFIEHYRNIYASPDNFIKRRVDYGKMKVFDEKYRKESERLKTFKDFPKGLNHLVKPLIKSGFYFIGNEKERDKVKCIYCQGILFDWKKTDNPEKEHRKAFPTCPYLLNLNVGNEYLKDDCKGVSTVDPDLKDIQGLIPYNIVAPTFSFDSMLYYRLDRDIEWREQSFGDFTNLKSLALDGLYMVTINGNKFIVCESCNKQVEILKGIEKLSPSLFHKTSCNYINSEVKIKTENDKQRERNNKAYCKIEYSIIDEEIEARLDSRMANEVEKLGLKRSDIKTLISTKLKTTGKDYGSIFELLLDLKSYQEDEPEIEMNNYEFILSDYSCVVCLDNTIAVVFLPCGHFRTCRGCSRALTTCPVCRKLIEKRVYGIRFSDDEYNTSK